LPWPKFVIGEDGLVSFIRWIVYSKVEGKEKLLIPKFDSLLEHLRRREAIFVMLGVKVEEIYGNKKCVHVKNQVLFIQILLNSIL
jgi:hypothetical protein